MCVHVARVVAIRVLAACLGSYASKALIIDGHGLITLVERITSPLSPCPSKWGHQFLDLRRGALAVRRYPCIAQAGGRRKQYECTEGSSMYDNYKLCPDLRPADICIVVEQYADGKFERCFHLHVRKSRLPQRARAELLHTLVARFYGFTGMGFDLIVSCYLNTRAKEPPHEKHLELSKSYPEPGVLRHYCGDNTRAWCDIVISPMHFRTGLTM